LVNETTHRVKALGPFREFQDMTLQGEFQEMAQKGEACQ
jgi:hypothetical protein